LQEVFKMTREYLIGLILRGPSGESENIIHSLEKSPQIRLVYVKRSEPVAFLLLIKTRRVGEQNHGHI
jgi:hypothetical protein